MKIKAKLPPIEIVFKLMAQTELDRTPAESLKFNEKQQNLESLAFEVVRNKRDTKSETNVNKESYYGTMRTARTKHFHPN